MSGIGKVEVYVQPTVDLESAIACAMMLNLFIETNDDYAVIQHSDGKLEIVEVEKL